jgi:hypothetical protein
MTHLGHLKRSLPSTEISEWTDGVITMPEATAQPVGRGLVLIASQQTSGTTTVTISNLGGLDHRIWELWMWAYGTSGSTYLLTFNGTTTTVNRGGGYLRN